MSWQCWPKSPPEACAYAMKRVVRVNNRSNWQFWQKRNPGPKQKTARDVVILENMAVQFGLRLYQQVTGRFVIESGRRVDARELVHSSDGSVNASAKGGKRFERTAAFLRSGQFAKGFEEVACNTHANPCHGRFLTRRKSEDFSCHIQTLSTAVLSKIGCRF